jgi:hypothetical protein
MGLRGESGKENERGLPGESGDSSTKVGVGLLFSDTSTGMRESRRIVSSEKILEKFRIGSVGARSLGLSGVSRMSDAFLIVSHRSASSTVADSAAD